MTRNRWLLVAGLLALGSGCGVERTPDRGELTASSGKVMGGEYVVRFQLGHWVGQEPFKAGTLQGHGAAAVTQ